MSFACNVIKVRNEGYHQGNQKCILHECMDKWIHCIEKKINPWFHHFFVSYRQSRSHDFLAIFRKFVALIKRKTNEPYIFNETNLVSKLLPSIDQKRFFFEYILRAYFGRFFLHIACVFQTFSVHVLFALAITVNEKQ